MHDTVIVFMKELFEKNQQTTKNVRGEEKYYILMLFGYQSIHGKYEPAHEIFILIVIAYTSCLPVYMHAQLSSGVKRVNFG